MKFDTIHVLFEQSGTFKNEFRKLGFEAYDYDIDNKFGETDFQIDLFIEIEKAYNNQSSIFDHIKKDDLIMSFFPCTYFSGQSQFIINDLSINTKHMDEERKTKYINDRVQKREWMFNLLLKYIEIVNRKKLRMVFENPYTQSYLLTRDSIKKPDIVITNRLIYGDDRVKPTGFWFYNLEPTYMSNFIQLNNAKKKIHKKTPQGIKRSLIHKDFAFNFINKYIMGVC